LRRAWHVPRTAGFDRGDARSIVNGFADADSKSSGGELRAEWSLKEDRLSATVAFGGDALEAVAGVVGMDLGELQSAIQSSLELALLELYNEHTDKQRLN
jgi:hypothetical protein